MIQVCFPIAGWKKATWVQKERRAEGGGDMGVERLQRIVYLVAFRRWLHNR